MKTSVRDGLADGLITVGAIAAFVSLFGIVGAPLGSLLGVSCISLPLNVRALAREANVSFKQLIRPLVPWFGRFVVLAVAAGAIAGVWTPATLPLIGLNGRGGRSCLWTCDVSGGVTRAARQLCATASAEIWTQVLAEFAR